jgi:hypothetical protein
MYLIEDGLLVKTPQQGGVYVLGMRQGPEQYVLTDMGAQLVDRWRQGLAVEDEEQPE